MHFSHSHSKASYLLHVFRLINYAGYYYGYGSPLGNSWISLPATKSDSVSVRQRKVIHDHVMLYT